MDDSVAIRVALAFVWIAAAGVGQLILLKRLKKFRTDILPHQSVSSGESALWQVNAYSAANYTPEGRERLKWVHLMTVAGFVGGLLILWI